MEYVFDCSKKIGHVGRYPRPIARFLSAFLTFWTGRLHDYWPDEGGI